MRLTGISSESRSPLVRKSRSSAAPLACSSSERQVSFSAPRTSGWRYASTVAGCGSPAKNPSAPSAFSRSAEVSLLERSQPFASAGVCRVGGEDGLERRERLVQLTVFHIGFAKLGAEHDGVRAEAENGLIQRDRVGHALL